MATSQLRIFISHSSLDNDFGIPLTQRLRGFLNNDALVWYDTEELTGGETWWRNIVRELTTRDVFILILSPDAMQSPWVQRELDIALNENKYILPLLYRPCEVRADLKILQMVSFLPPRDYEVAFNELLVALSRWEKIAAEHVPDPQARLILPQGHAGASGNRRRDWGEAPDIPVFFGRTRDLLEKVNRTVLPKVAMSQQLTCHVIL